MVTSGSDEEHHEASVVPEEKGKPPASTGRQFGNQTLARGLRALVAVVESPNGMTAQELAAELGVHRSIAYRTLQTLVEHHFLSTGEGVYFGGSRLASLSAGFLPSMRAAALPPMRELADETGAAVTLFVAEHGRAVAIEMVEPTTVRHHFAFRQGMWTSLDRGAAAYSLLAAGPVRPGEPEGVALARSRGYAFSAGEIEEGAYGVAAPILGTRPQACLNIITHLEDRAAMAAPRLIEAAESISTTLSGVAR